MHAGDRHVLERVDRFVGDYLTRAATREAVDLDVEAWGLPDVDGRPGRPVPFPQAVSDAVFLPLRPGDSWGRAWGTTWLRVTGTVPAAWEGRAGRIEASIDLGFNAAKPGFQCEGLVRAADGTAVKGLEPRNHHVPVRARPGESIVLYVEAASNPDLSGGNDFASPTAFAPTPLGGEATAGDADLYRLGVVEVRLVDVAVEDLRRELIVLSGLAGVLEPHDPRRAAIVRALDRALASVDPAAPGRSAGRARAELSAALAAPAVTSAHRIVATGHAHIDSAWLWPARETVRKITRTFANVLDLMEDDPDAVFVCSSAQHFAWVKDNDPELYARVKARVAEGRFIPVGNMWVESDVNMPSGESLARQLLYGTRFFEEEFGARSDVGWLPDSFGYPGSLPQILRRAGLRWFFTQKMCWNDTDRMPHHSFLWEGIDGSRIFTHFPPNNTYSGDMRPVELARSVRGFADHGGASTSLMPFGYGDGGGGPTREMMADARLQSDLEGSPRVRFGTPREFFLDAEAEYADAPVWSGEMYLQFHRGVYTSQARTKRGNRRNEALLVEAELWCATATVRTGRVYPHDELDALWREVLLLQFHDILPGSAIAWVHREAEASHTRTEQALDDLIRDALRALAGEGALPMTANPAAHPLAGVPALGVSPAVAARGYDTETCPDGDIVLRSDALEVVIGPDGCVRRLIDRRSGRDLIPAGRAGNVLQIHVDAPARWDAWDIDAPHRLSTTDLRSGTVDVDEDGAVRVRRRAGESTIAQRLALSSDGGSLRIETRVSWHERQRLLKLAFPFDVHASDASYETAFGFQRRPVHTNTSWDAARFEVCAHRWVHVGEPGFGVVVANDRVYGHDVTREHDDGRTTTTVRQSLLRGATFPDPDADQGDHVFVTVIAPAATTADAARHGASLGSPARTLQGAHEAAPIVSIAPGSTAVVSAVKLAADRSGDVVVRIFEQSGARTTAALAFGFDIERVVVCDLVETAGASAAERTPSRIELELRPFEVLTLRVTPAEGRGA